MIPVGTHVLITFPVEHSPGVSKAVVKGVPSGLENELKSGDIIIFRKGIHKEVIGHYFVDAETILVIERKEPVAS